MRQVVDDRGAVGVALEALEGAGRALRTGGGGAVAQPLVEHLAVDHADEAALDVHVDLLVLGRDHARAVDLGDQQTVGDGEVADQARRDRAAAGLDPPGPVEQQHRAAAPGEIGRRRGSGWAAADHHDVEGPGVGHVPHLPPRPAA